MQKTENQQQQNQTPQIPDWDFDYSFYVIDKLCSENEVFQIQNLDEEIIQQNIKPNSITPAQEQKDKDNKLVEQQKEKIKGDIIYNFTLPQSYTHQIKQPIQQYYDPFDFDKNENVYYIFLKVFIKQIFFYLLFGWIFGFVFLIFSKKTHSTPYFILYLIAGFYFIFGSSFFWTYVAYITQTLEEMNSKFYGLNALTLTECIYFNLLIAGFGIVDFYYQKSIDEGKTAIDKLEISNNQLFFESMDRIKFDGNKFDKSYDQIYLYTYTFSHEHSEFIESLHLKKYKVIPKRWYSGYHLIQIECKKKQNFWDSYKINAFLAIVGLPFVFVHLFLPIYYLSDQQQDDFDSWNLASITLVNLFYALSSIYNCYNQGIQYFRFSKVEHLTSLLEVKSNLNNFQLKKNVSSINIYCVQSIKTWFNIRFYLLEMNQKFSRFGNIIQTIEVIVFLTLSIILIMDYSGAGWQKYQIINNPILFGLLLTNALTRLILFIIPLFFNFSYVNNLLQYNKDQIYSLKGKLENISIDYKLIRGEYFNQIKEILRKQHLLEQQDENTFLKRLLHNNFKDIITEQKQIEQMRAIYEIIRNSKLYHTEQSNQKPYEDLNEDEKINQEQEYLSKLIKTYKMIYKDMIVYEDRHSLKFLGIVTISYARAQTLAVIAIPALFSIILQNIISKNQ